MPKQAPAALGERGIVTTRCHAKIFLIEFHSSSQAVCHKMITTADINPTMTASQGCPSPGCLYARVRRPKTKKHRRCCDNLPGGRYDRQKSSAITDGGCNKQCHDHGQERHASERGASCFAPACLRVDIDGDISVDSGNVAGQRLPGPHNLPLSGRWVACRVHDSCVCSDVPCSAISGRWASPPHRHLCHLHRRHRFFSRPDRRQPREAEKTSPARRVTMVQGMAVGLQAPWTHES